MSGNKLLLDTNILLYLLNWDGDIVEILDGKDLYISFITELELLSFHNLNKNAEQKIKELLN